MIGKSLLHYTLVAELGRGGMGAVYLAEDTRLQRKVALKVLPDEFARDPARRSRFDREARAVASLNHPNIVTLHSVEETGGVHFLTMEYVEGRSLAETIPARGLSVSDFFRMAIPLADAVASAHARGVTHRDLKPDNILVDADGRLRILDFGLAKLREEGPEAAEPESRTATQAVTEEGKILGTVAYMAPEQAEGKPVDHRADLFALGILFYEMATGRHPFEGDTKLSILSSIMKDRPPALADVRRGLPRQLGRIIHRCLRKDPQRRFQTALDLRNELEELKEELDSGVLDAPMAQPAPRKNPLAWAVAAASVGVALVLAGLWILRPGGGEAGTSRPLDGTFTQLTTLPGVELFPSLSPDGGSFVYAGCPKENLSGNFDIYFQRVGGNRALRLTDDPMPDSQPAFSPDGDRIAFRSERDGGGIFVMGATGESVRRVTDFGFNPDWSPGGEKLVFAQERVDVGPDARHSVSSLWTVDVRTSELKKLYAGDAVQPAWSPDGARIAFWGLPPEGGQRDLFTIAADGGDLQPVTQDAALDWNPVWSPDGAYLYFSSNRGGSYNVWRIPMEPGTGRPAGQPEAVTRGVGGPSFHMDFARNSNRMIYSAASVEGGIYRFDVIGELSSLTPPAPVIQRSGRIPQWVEISPDGQWLTFIWQGTQEDIFVARADGSELRQLLDEPGKHRLPTWSPQGDEIAFFSDRSGNYEIWSIRPDGSGLRRVSVLPGKDSLFPVWSPEGDQLVFTALTDGEVYVLDKKRFGQEGGARRIEALSKQDRIFAVSAWSPDGRYLAGHAVTQAQDDGRLFVYDWRENQVTVLDHEGLYPSWYRDTRTLIYASEDGIYSLTLGEGDPKRLVQLDELVTPSAPRTTVDGEHLFMELLTFRSDIWLLEF